MSAVPEHDVETGELVATEPRVLEPAKPAGQVAAQAAAVAATSFVAGTAVAALVRGRKGRRAARRSGRRKDVNVVATRSFLVDVHLIDPRK
jgi:hypothetical protein